MDGGGGGKKATSTNVGFGPQYFLTFSFNLFVTLVQNFKFQNLTPRL